MESSTYPSIETAVGVVAGRMVGTYIRNCALNAEAGYPHNLPAPEVFEWPGEWQRWLAPSGNRQVEFVRDTGPPPISSYEEFNPFDTLEVKRTIIEPALTSDVLIATPTGGEAYVVGLGCHPPTQRWVIFHWRKTPCGT